MQKIKMDSIMEHVETCGPGLQFTKVISGNFEYTKLILNKNNIISKAVEISV